MEEVTGRKELVLDRQGKEDLVNHPSHYTWNKIECIDCVEAVTESYAGVDGFLAGNVVKYLYRANYKNGIEDLEKARWYLNKLIERQAEENKPEA